MADNAELIARIAELEQLLADHEEVAADRRRLVRALDVAMHGEDGAAPQASLCDLIGPAADMRQRISALEAQIARDTAFEEASRYYGEADLEKAVDHMQEAIKIVGHHATKRKR